jgi:hypothetical protein
MTKGKVTRKEPIFKGRSLLIRVSSLLFFSGNQRRTMKNIRAERKPGGFLRFRRASLTPGREYFIMLFKPAEVESSLVGLPDFKSGVPSEEGGRWVRFPCTSAIFFARPVRFGPPGLTWGKGFGVRLLPLPYFRRPFFIPTSPFRRRIHDIFPAPLGMVPSGLIPPSLLDLNPKADPLIGTRPFSPFPPWERVCSEGFSVPPGFASGILPG